MTDWSKAPWVDPALDWTPMPVPDLPPRVLIDFATRCNLRCPMCTVWGSGDQEAIDDVKGVMPPDAAERLLDELAPARPLVQPNMYGEPLLIPDLAGTIRAMKCRGMEVALNTNGLALSQAVSDMLVAEGVDSVSVSIDAVTPGTLALVRGLDRLEAIEAGVFRLLAARGRALTPRISVSFTVQDTNRHEADAFVERWISRVDCVRVGLLFENGTFPEMETPAERRPCPTLYNTLPVFNDGTATICCLDGFKVTDVGNVFEQGAQAVWTGEAFAKVRYFHETGQWDKVPFCTNCNGWAQLSFEETEADGILVRRSPQIVYYNRVDRLENWRNKLRSAHEGTNAE
ncbi:radical SAM/SPASM domain-containing protein [Magnetospirillum sp. UT-4]|uniref:radical SAM/SPASM domain-containing protein n=1 Tax=Magnetospirillum sp. UT-4 TaxID=2681467 RepID=UPI001382BDEC|nr:radical SAM protein [Magnetospirillum sp. UT-4]CAA7612102.1 Radical SAM superfamily [Magnetospirillum sp. UT-4]